MFISRFLLKSIARYHKNLSADGADNTDLQRIKKIQ